VTSSATLTPMPRAAEYTASKMAIEGFTGSLAHELEAFNVRVKLVEPDDCQAFAVCRPSLAAIVTGSGVGPLAGQERPIKAGEFILGYPGEAGVPLPTPQPDILGRNGTYVGLRKYQSRVGAFNRFLRANGSTEEERELLAAKLVGRWRSGAPLTLAPDVDNPVLGADPHRNNDFN
jgi:hypothetical protein